MSCMICKFAGKRIVNGMQVDVYTAAVQAVYCSRLIHVMCVYSHTSHKRVARVCVASGQSRHRTRHIILCAEWYVYYTGRSK